MLQRVEFTPENLQRWADCNQEGDEDSMSPEGWKKRVLDFAEAKMQAPRLARELLATQEKLYRLQEVLSFYADPKAWNQPPLKTRQGMFTTEYENEASKMQADRGRRARQILEELGL